MRDYYGPVLFLSSIVFGTILATWSWVDVLNLPSSKEDMYKIQVVSDGNFRCVFIQGRTGQTCERVSK